MTLFRRLSQPLFALVLALCATGMQAQYGPPPPQQGGYGQGGGYGPGGGQGGWDAPPGAYRQYQRQGFQDGVQGARKDVENRRRPNVNNRDEFRHPNVPGQFRRDYKDGFRRGYNVAMQHLLNGGGGRR